MDKRKRSLIKYTALVLILLSALLLSACRTRITNNNEVSNVYYDEDGYMSETYETRRSELGLSVAKKPLLPDFGSGEDNEEDFDTGESINYEPETEQYVEPPEAQNANNTNNTNNTNNSTTTTRRYIPRNTNRSTTTRTTGRVTIKFDATGGKCNTTEKRIYKGNKIGSLPEATKDGSKFTGWYTSKTGGSAVTSSTKASSDTTLYAHWEEDKKSETDNKSKKKTKPKQKKKPTENKQSPSNNSSENTNPPEEQPAVQPVTHTITLNYNDGGNTNDGSIKVTEDGKYSGLPEKVTSSRIGYEFDCWCDENGNTIENGKEVGKNPPKSLIAKWNYYPDKYWDNEFDVSANRISSGDKWTCVIEGQTKGKKSLIEACKGNVTTEKKDAEVVIKFIDNMDDEKASEAATEIMGKTVSNGGEYPEDVIILLIDSDAVETNDKNQKIIYKMMILEELYGDGYWSEGNSISKAKGSDELDADGVKPIKK